MSKQVDVDAWFMYFCQNGTTGAPVTGDVAADLSSMRFIKDPQTGSGTAFTPVDTASADYQLVEIGGGYYRIMIPGSGGATANNDTEGVCFVDGISANGILSPVPALVVDPVPGDHLVAILAASEATSIDANVRAWLDVAVSAPYGGYPLANVLATGTCGTGSTSSTIELASVTFDNEFVGATVLLTGNTGVGQVATITGSTASSNIATVVVHKTLTWTTTPDGTTTYAILSGGLAMASDGGILDTDDVTVAAASQSAIVTAVWAAGTRTLTAIDDILSVAAKTAIAQRVWAITLNSVTGDAGRTFLQAMRMLRNKVVIDRSAGTFTVYEEDDVSPSHSGVVTTESGDAVASMDPS